MKPLLARLKDEILVCDGAMGTMLTGGLKVTYATEELNLKDPSRVQKVHDGYIAAGAQIIETNTFGANEIALKKWGLESLVEEINAAGVRIAKKAAEGKDIYIAGSVGPDNGKASVNIYLRQIAALVNAGVDLVIIETMSSLDEALNAITATRSVSKDIPLIVQIACRRDFLTKTGVDGETFVRELNTQPVDVIGVNCHSGPKQLFPVFEQIRYWTKKPLSVQPNIGEVTFSEQDIDYSGADTFNRYTKRFIAAGARIIGGCCGTTPRQIKTIADAVAKNCVLHEKIEIINPEPKLKRFFSSRLERMLLEKHPFPIIEVDPPFIGEPVRDTIGYAERLYHAGVRIITIGDNPGAVPRMDNLAFASIVRERLPQVDIILHLSCRDATIISSESKISGAEALGIYNILAITGDPPSTSKYDKSISVNNLQSIGLIRLLQQRNQGLNALGEHVVEPSNIFIGCAFDHGRFSSEKFKNTTKYAAGADFALTQIISDLRTVESLAAYTAETEKSLWNKHQFYMIPGTYLFSSAKNMNKMQELFRIKIAPESLREMEACATRKAQRDCGYALAKEIVLASKQYFPAVYIVPPAKNADMIIKLLKETGLV